MDFFSTLDKSRVFGSQLFLRKTNGSTEILKNLSVRRQKKIGCVFFLSVYFLIDNYLFLIIRVAIRVVKWVEKRGSSFQKKSHTISDPEA